MYIYSFIWIWLINIILPFIFIFLIYKKYIKKFAPKLKISNWKIFLDIFISLLWSNLIAWLIIVDNTSNSIQKIILYFIWNSIIIVTILYLILLIMLSQKKLLTKNTINKISLYTSWISFLIILVTLLIWFFIKTMVLWSLFWA